MHLPARTPAVATLALLIISCIVATGIAAQPATGVVRGEVTDASGGVLPGVTVTVAAADGRILAKTVTDAVGRYAIRALPGGLLTLVFELDAFDTESVNLVMPPGGESWLVERLTLAKMTEEVVVYGRAPVDPPPPPPPPPLPAPRPRPTVIPVPAQELESVCKPAKPGPMAHTFGTIQSHRYDSDRTLYAKGDELVIKGGTLNGLEVGQNLVVVRHFRANSLAADVAQMGEHAAGLVQIVDADERSSTAVVVYACNELMKGDLLAAFTPEPVRIPEPAGTPAYDDAARILFAGESQMLGVPRRLMVIDRGSEQGMRAGQRLTLFRRTGANARLLVLGEAIVVSVRSHSATIRVQRATEAIEFGDWAAPQR